VEAIPTPPREAMPAGDLAGLAAAAIGRSDVKPTVQPGLVPAAQPEERPAAIDPSEFYRTKIITQESGGRQFDNNGNPLTSSAGAIGIGQIMPDTAPEAARMAGLPWDEERFRTDADYNAALGEAYFKNMYDRFGSLELASAAYNAGPGRLRSALDRAAAMGGSYLDYLPEETQNYVASVTGAGSASRGVAGGMPTGDEYSNIVNMSSKGVAGGAGSQSGSEEYKGGLGLTPDKPYEERTAVGKMFYNPDGTVNKDALLSILSGIGTMASSPSLYLGSAILQGIGGAANTYAGLEEQRGTITKQNLDNASEFMKSYMRALEYGYAGTARDYAREIKYTGPISLTEGLTGVQDDTGSTREFMGAPLDPFGRGMNATISVEGPDGRPVEVMAGQTLGYLKALETKLARDVEMGISSPALLEQVRTAIANHRGQITTSDGDTIADPTFRDTVFGAAGQESDTLTTVDLTKALPGITQSAYEAQRNTNELAKALSELPTTGILSPWIATFGNVATQLGLTESSDAATAYEKAMKVISGDIETSLSQLGGSVDTSVLAAAIRNARANPSMTGGAIEELLAIRAGMADYQIRRAEALNAARRDPNANLAQVDREFAFNNPVEKFVDARRPEFEGTIGAAPVAVRPDWVPEADWNGMSEEERQEAIAMTPGQGG
jgi:hypothetical protein